MKELRKRWIWVILLSFIVILGACSPKDEKEPNGDDNTETPVEDPANNDGEDSDPVTNNPEEEEEPENPIIEGEEKTLATNLKVPWAIDFDGENFYISQREGSIVRVSLDGEVVEEQVQLSDNLSDASEAGFLGFLLHPEQENTAFAYYTYENASGQFNRVVVLKNEDGVWKETDILLDRIPSGFVHHGGRIKIGPDGKLYVTAGDAANPSVAQNLQSLGGKILRMNLDGSIPEDNPFEDSYVYSYGHRNPQGLVWDEQGVLYSSEHGQSAHDEINRIKAGVNYGWPNIQGDQEAQGMKKPLAHSGQSTWAPSGMDIWEGVLFVAQLRGEGILAVNPSTGETKQVITGYGRIRDVFILDGYLFFVTNNTDGRGNPGPEDDRFIAIKLKEEFKF